MFVDEHLVLLSHGLQLLLMKQQPHALRVHGCLLREGGGGERRGELVKMAILKTQRTIQYNRIQT